MWVTAYRPETLDSVAMPPERRACLVNFMKDNGANMPHLILFGPAGTGKTSTAHAIAKDLNALVLSVNASDERGIDMVRNTVAKFASRSSERPKIIILDEADSMTPDAQGALREIIERYAVSTRFIIICNYIGKIIDPIVSRCMRMHYACLSEDVIRSRLETIAASEGIALDDGVITRIVSISSGDMRRMVTLMQSSVIPDQNRVTLASIERASDAVPIGLVDATLATALGGDYDASQDAVNAFLNAGYSAIEMIKAFHERVHRNAAIPNEKKGNFAIAAANAEIALCKDADQRIQMMCVMVSLW